MKEFEYDKFDPVSLGIFLPDLDTPEILAAKLSPAIVVALDADEDGIVAAIPSAIGRFLLRRAWPLAMTLVPHAVLATVRAVVAVFGTMTVDDFLTFLANWKAKNGIKSTPDNTKDYQ